MQHDNTTTTVAASHRFNLFFFRRQKKRSWRGRIYHSHHSSRVLDVLQVSKVVSRSRDGRDDYQASPDEEGSRSAASNSAVIDVGGVEKRKRIADKDVDFVWSVFCGASITHKIFYNRYSLHSVVLMWTYYYSSSITHFIFTYYLQLLLRQYFLCPLSLGRYGRETVRV